MSQQVQRNDVLSNTDSRRIHRRALEAVIWGMPAVSMLDHRDGYFDATSASYGDVVYLSQQGEARHEALTPNNQTPYLAVFFDLREGSMVLDVPGATDTTIIFGSATDIWQVPAVDIGLAGEDQGEGGKYLFVAPDHAGEVPDGYIVVPMNVNWVIVVLRLVPVGEGTFAIAAAHAKNVSSYPLADAHSPAPTRYTDSYPVDRLPTLPRYDIRYFHQLARLVNEELPQEKDKVMLGMLASLGVEKGVTFNPDERTREILELAVSDAWGEMQSFFIGASLTLFSVYDDRQWTEPRPPTEEGFVFDAGDHLLLDHRASVFFWATFFPKQLGRASLYFLAQRDEGGDLLAGDGTYRLHVPADVPVRDFWSVVAYGTDTKAFLYNQLGRVGLSSYDLPGMQIDESGGVDIYFGPEAPDGLESNWIPTGKDFFLLFRFYGPEEQVFDRSFKLADVERIG